MKDIDRRISKVLGEKGVHIEQLKGKKIGEVKELTEEYKRQVNELED